MATDAAAPRGGGGNPPGPGLDGLGAEATGPVPSSRLTEASLALMVLIWGLNFAVVKYALAGFRPMGFNAMRFAIASAVVYAVLRSRGPVALPERRDVPRVLALGLVGNVLYQVAFILGLARTRAGDAALMLAVVPVFMLLFGVSAGERHGPRAWVGAMISVVGVALVGGAAVGTVGTAALVGDAVLIGAAVCWTLYTLGARPLIERYGPVSTTAWTLWTGAAGLAVLGLPSLLAQRWSTVGAAGWLGLLYSAVLSIALAYLLWYRGVERIGGARTAVYSNLTPVVALLAGAIGLGERLTLLSGAGAAMVIAGVILVRE